MKEIKNKELIKLLKQRLDKAEVVEKENSYLLKQIEDLNIRLTEAEQFKSHFISNITNEIINPFSSVTGLAKTIMNLKGKDIEKAPVLASHIYSEAAFLDFQLNNIFAAANLEAGELLPEIAPVNIEEAINHSIGKLQYEMDKRNIKTDVSIEDPENSGRQYFFKTDPEKLKLIIINLISNAVKASKENGQIGIRAEVKGNNLTIKVSDNGNGIDKTELKRIFDRFYRSDKGINSLNPGNGLGLAVVKGLLDLLEGTIKIESEKGKGTTVTLILPEHDRDEQMFEEEGLFSDGDEILF